MFEAKLGNRWQTSRRKALALAATGLLAACQIVPKAPPESTAPPPPPPSTALPTDTGRHRVALLVPLTGANAAAGQALANAATMALLDTNASNLRITTYDTGPGAPAAASKAVADGNKLILGPLLGEEAQSVAVTARGAHVPVISFSNDTAAAGGNVFVMGAIPAQSISRVVHYARSIGATRFAALIPVGVYGQRASSAMIAAVKGSGGTLVGMESYDRARGGITVAARKLKARGPYDAVLIADGAHTAALAAPILKAGNPQLRILGPELWSGEAVVAKTPTLNGALFAALSDQRYRRFVDTYKTRYGTAPYRIATLSYDSVLLTLRVAREWPAGTTFPTQRLYDHGGFLGLDGVFRFNTNDIIERALEVREARGGVVSVVSPAPTRFDD